MELSELSAYAGEKYQIPEQHKWADFPGFSVLCHPKTGKWVALLMRQWDTETGCFIERCDIKCGRESLYRLRQPYLTLPVRMHGAAWIGVCFDSRTEPEVVFQLLDQAVAAGNPHGVTIVLEGTGSAQGAMLIPGGGKTGTVQGNRTGRGNQAAGVPQGNLTGPGSGTPAGESVYRDTALPFAGRAAMPQKEQPPEKLREMRHLYEYGRESAESRARNFKRQAVFMQDYEDDCPWTGGDFVRYFPTYHDLTTRELRGYFTWRTRLRKGDYRKIPTSAAYIYIYELLNGVGAASPEECLSKLREFEKGFLDAGFGDARMRTNLTRWMLEYAVLHDLPKETARQAADPEMLSRDEALAVLKDPKEHTDREVFSALCSFGSRKTENSPVLANDPERGMRLFSEAWREASAYTRDGKGLFTLCFGEPESRLWYPLSNTVYYEETRPEDRDYTLDGCRRFYVRNGVWRVEAYEKLSFDKALFQGFLHEADARLRRYLKTGRYLKESAADAWAVPYIDAAAAADRKAAEEAARPKITIDFSGLDRIRRDALATRDSLLTEEDLEEISGTTAASPAAEEKPAETAASPACGIPLDEVQIRILRVLLEGGDPAGIIREHHLMPSIVADAINEAFFDEIGDTVLLCEGDALALVEDYTEDIRNHLGGTLNG